MRRLQPTLSPTVKSFIMLGDLITLLLSVFIVFQQRMMYWSADVLLAPGLWVIILIVLANLYIFGAYDLDRVQRFISVFLRQTLAVFVGLLAVVAINYLMSKDRTGLFGRSVLIGSLLLFLFFSSLYRWILKSIFTKVSEKVEWLFLTSDHVMDFFSKDIEKNPVSGKFHYLSSPELNMLEENLNRPWDSIVIAMEPKSLSKNISRVLMRARLNGQRIIDLVSFYESIYRKVPIYFLEHEWFIMTEGFQLLHFPIAIRIKRLVDLFLAFFLLILIWPVMLIAAIIIKLESQGPIFYRQIRTGKDGVEFSIYKFRSMRTDAEAQGAQWASKNDPRITRWGKFIRLTRIDELPQLFNVLRGEMSFIGPRPERPEFDAILEKEIPFYNLRHLVRPGITGWAQVMYPYGASVEDAKEKLQYDLFYIKNYSLLLDFLIVLRTISIVLLGKGR